MSKLCREIFCYMLSVVVARPSYDDSTIRYVLRVLRMTSRFHIIGSVGQNQSSSSLGGSTGAKSAILNCLISIILYNICV